MAKLGSAPDLPPDSSGQPKPELSGSGYSKKLSGSGYDLPTLENLQWEGNDFGGFEAWHSPPGAVHRREKTYLGYLGKRQLAKWGREPPEQFRALVCEWVAQKRAEKGL